VNWKKAIVPKSPMEQPRRHKAVFFDARRQGCGGIASGWRVSW